MDGSLAASAVAACAATIGAGVTYAVARRRHGGRIDTTEAAVLWTESQAMRRELRDELVACRSECAQLRQEVSVLRQRLDDLEEAAG